MNAVPLFGFLLFIKASHVGNSFLSACTLFLHLHLDRNMIPCKLFMVSIPSCSKAAAMQHAVLCGYRLI